MKLISISTGLAKTKIAEMHHNDMRKKVQKQEKPVSICDVMKGNTSKIIKKLETQIPMSFQSYSDLYKEYLHSLDDMFGTCYIAEKEIIDKMGFDKDALKNFQKISDDLTSVIENQIEIMKNIEKSQLEMQDSMMKAFDYYVHFMMDSYAKYLSAVNETIKPSK